jgi:predicted nucleic acid-binding protein
VTGQQTEIRRAVLDTNPETEVVPGLYDVAGACSDPDDDKFLACAVEGRADFIVTADRSHLLILHPYRLIDHIVQIVTADAFLADLAGG